MNLKSTTYGCVYIDGNPYQKGSLMVSYAGDNITVCERENYCNVLINNKPFGAVYNVDDDEYFQSLNELKVFVEANFFFDVSEGGGGGGGEPVIVECPYISERFVIPADFSGTIARTAIANITVHTIKVWFDDNDGSGEYNPKNYPYNLSGSINLSSLNLLENDVVIVTGKKIA